MKNDIIKRASAILGKLVRRRKAPPYKQLETDNNNLRVLLEEAKEELKQRREHLGKLESKLSETQEKLNSVKSEYEKTHRRYKEEVEKRLENVLDVMNLVMFWKLYPNVQEFKPEQLKVLNLSEKAAEELQRNNKRINTLNEMLSEPIIDSLDIARNLGKAAKDIEKLPIAFYSQGTLRPTKIFQKYVKRSSPELQQIIENKLATSDYTPIETEAYRVEMSPHGIETGVGYIMVSYMPRREEKVFSRRIGKVKEVLKKAWDNIAEKYKDARINLNEKKDLV